MAQFAVQEDCSDSSMDAELVRIHLEAGITVVFQER